MRRPRRVGLQKFLDVPVEEVGLEGREVELSRRLVDQRVSLLMRVVGETGENPVEGPLDVRLSQAHGAILPFGVPRV